MKLRTIITQDAEVDDQNSLRHFLLYANEVDLLGIVQTASKYHWRGAEGVKDPEEGLARKFLAADAPFDKPYRWPGTEWMNRVIDNYAADYPNLKKQSEDYPDPESLRAVTKIGNVGYMGEMDTPSDGSELIRKAILSDDPRKLYIQVWGGCNTIARALSDIRAEFGHTPAWKAMHKAISEKVVLTACGEQDETYRSYIAEDWPGIQFVKMLQMGSYAYPWKTMPDGESRDTLGAAFMREEILCHDSALVRGYCTWMDGHFYEGEEPASQFGTNPNIAKEWFGARFGLPDPEPFDFLSEGDSPTYFALLPWGLRTLENFSWGGAAGRYLRREDKTNSKGEPLNYWEAAQDSYTDKSGAEHLTESMWRYTADIQRDFAARAAWAAGERGEHAPSLEIAEGTDVLCAPGGTLTLHAEASAGAEVSFRIYPEAGADWSKDASLRTEGAAAVVTVPAHAAPGSCLHVIAKAQAGGRYRLVRYRQIVIEIS